MTPTQAQRGSDVVGAQLMTFTQSCKYIHLFVPDSEPNTGLENKTESLCSSSLQCSKEDRKLSKY